MTKSKKQKWTADLEHLESLQLGELQVLWREYFSEPMPDNARKGYLLDELAYKIQSKLYGGIPKELNKQIKRLALGKVQSTRPKPVVSEGVKLVRSWRGVKHMVAVTQGGFEYKGEIYNSLSRIAKVITGSHCSGPAFFGLKKRGVCHDA